ncbi:hypothetical protein [Endozoicomonas sp. 8E]|uniref:hypothetical protein n=1 Tax=Endozoicomonas sp. 8E TaxID=3035692 RepID=UPI0029390BF8|nr:hypothetical protein [Endozoicomonas sp. 8E]WOG25878.1 hypothetical protein P6910_14995 [Endozoicomonas sp. 8E]
MKRFIRLVTILGIMVLPRIGYSGDDRYDALLPLTAFQLSQMLRVFIEETLPRYLLNLKEVRVWSFNRDHYSSDGGLDEQTVDGVMVVTASFHTPLLDVDVGPQPQSLKSYAVSAIINASFLSILPLLTEYFRVHFNPDKNYYLGRANIERSQGAAADSSPDDSGDEFDVNPGFSNDEGEAAAAAAEIDNRARAMRPKCGCFECSNTDCDPVFESPQYWKAHLLSNREQGIITYEATLYYSGFLDPASIAESCGEPGSEQKDGDEWQSEEEDEALITQTRQCIDLYNEGLDKGLSKHLFSDSDP